MSLRIYLDDCAFSYRLRQLLIDTGHQVQVPADVVPPLTGLDDALHFAHAQVTSQLILTYHPADFQDLHQTNPKHPGILAVYQDNDLSRDMTYRDIVRAIANLESLNILLADEFWILNAYQW